MIRRRREGLIGVPEERCRVGQIAAPIKYFFLEKLEFVFSSSPKKSPSKFQITSPPLLKNRRLKGGGEERITVAATMMITHLPHLNSLTKKQINTPSPPPNKKGKVKKDKTYPIPLALA